MSSYTAAIFGRGKGILFSRSVSHQCYCYSTSTCTPLRNRSFERPVSFDSVKFNLQFVFRFRAQCYSTKKGSAKVSRERKLDPTESATAPMEQEKDAFFVVRKGDVVGVYKSFTDCQAQIGSSVILFSPLYYYGLIFLFVQVKLCAFDVFLLANT